MSREVRVVELYQNSLGDIPGILRGIANDIEEGKREADSAHLILVDADGHIDEFFSAGRFVFTRHSLMGMLEDAKLYIADFFKPVRGSPDRKDSA